MRYQFICSVVCWVHANFTVEPLVEVGESSARVWPFGHAAGTVGLAGLGMDQMVLFFCCDFFWGLAMLKRSDVLWRHWFGRSLRPGKPSNSPRWCGGRHDGAEGAISTKQNTCLHWAVSEANSLSALVLFTLDIHICTCALVVWVAAGSPKGAWYLEIKYARITSYHYTPIKLWRCENWFCDKLKQVYCFTDVVVQISF